MSRCVRASRGVCGEPGQPVGFICTQKITGCLVDQRVVSMFVSSLVGAIMSVDGDQRQLMRIFVICWPSPSVHVADVQDSSVPRARPRIVPIWCCDGRRYCFFPSSPHDDLPSPTFERVNQCVRRAFAATINNTDEHTILAFFKYVWCAVGRVARDMGLE